MTIISCDVTPIGNLVELVVLKLEDNPILDTSPLYPLLEANGGKLRAYGNGIVSVSCRGMSMRDGSVDETDVRTRHRQLGTECERI